MRLDTVDPEASVWQCACAAQQLLQLAHGERTHKVDDVYDTAHRLPGWWWLAVGGLWFINGHQGLAGASLGFGGLCWRGWNEIFTLLLQKWQTEQSVSCYSLTSSEPVCSLHTIGTHNLLKKAHVNFCACEYAKRSLEDSAEECKYTTADCELTHWELIYSNRAPNYPFWLCMCLKNFLSEVLKTQITSVMWHTFHFLSFLFFAVFDWNLDFCICFDDFQFLCFRFGRGLILIVAVMLLLGNPGVTGSLNVSGVFFRFLLLSHYLWHKTFLWK